MTGSTSSQTAGQSARERGLRALGVLGAVFAAGALTALVFLVRAGSEGASNWPVGWELRSSDNGVLFQLLQDVAAGRTLDWSFSPQVYVFPELPVSALAYLLAAGDVYVYYLFVAALNNALLFAAVLLVVRLLFRASPLRAQLLRAGIAFVPLLVLPLVGTSWLFQYHLAPTYYFGMYLLLIAAPAVFLVRSRAARVALAAGIALTAASNPLALVFAFPAFVIVLLVVAFRSGFRSVRRPALLAGVILLAALLVRVLAFAPLQGTSPLSYIDLEVFATRIDALGPYFEYLVSDASAAVILALGVIAALLCLTGAVIAALRYIRRREHDDRRLLVLAWYGLVPLTGLAGTVLLLITHYLYFWPIVVLPLVLVLIALPAGSLRWVGAVSAVLVIVVAVAAGALTSFPHLDRFFGHRNAETECLDEQLPRGSEIGYATFSDARRLALTSDRGIRLIPLKSDGDQAGWLANLDYLHADTGRFFYLNDHGDEAAIDRVWITDRFGDPQRILTCAPGQELWLYEDDAALDRIGDHFDTRDR